MKEIQNTYNRKSLFVFLENKIMHGVTKLIDSNTEEGLTNLNNIR